MVRVGAWAREDRRRRVLAVALTAALYRRWSVQGGLEIPFRTEIGPGLRIIHRGGVIIHPDSRLGPGCTLAPGVVLVGMDSGERSGAPVLGARVRVAVGAKVIGQVTLGDDVEVGANAVVTRDVPAGSVVAGVPAHPLEGVVPRPSRHADFEQVLVR
jgi:serine O-acetyltransferase